MEGNPRFVDDPRKADGGAGTPPIADLGAYEVLSPAPLAVSKFGNGSGSVSGTLIDCVRPAPRAPWRNAGLAFRDSVGGSYFAGWTGACSGTAGCSTTSPAWIGARFEPNTLTVAKSGRAAAR